MGDWVFEGSSSCIMAEGSFRGLVASGAACQQLGSKMATVCVKTGWRMQIPTAWVGFACLHARM